MGPNCGDNNVLSVLKLRQVVSCIWCTGTVSKHMNSYRLWHAHIISQGFTFAVDLWLVASRGKSTRSVCLNLRSPASKDTAYPLQSNTAGIIITKTAWFALLMCTSQCEYAFFWWAPSISYCGCITTSFWISSLGHFTSFPGNGYRWKRIWTSFAIVLTNYMPPCMRVCTAFQQLKRSLEIILKCLGPQLSFNSSINGGDELYVFFLQIQQCYLPPQNWCLRPINRYLFLYFWRVRIKISL